MKFYCNGKQGICDCDILCADCNFFDNSGGKMVQGKEVQTNADRIRAMTDEDLAKLIVKHKPMHSWPDAVRKIYFGFEDHRKDNPVRAWLEWLQQPAEE